ncbi:hypothetical protein I4U23_014256 [Adineta vaga]|nr:hypothetical protein I4U23_014256 [Adineta vaga]
MPFSRNGKYKPSKEFKMRIGCLIAQYVGSSKMLCKKREYIEVLNEFINIDEKYQPIHNDNVSTYVATRNDCNERKMGKTILAIQTILNKLYKMRNIDEENDDYMEVRKGTNNVPKKMWNLWCNEREQRPRAGIIIIFFEESGKIKVLLTKYYKNNDPQYGYAKGKINIDENIKECAIREVSEELGLNDTMLDDMVKEIKPIRKDVYMDNKSITHYYFIVSVTQNNFKFQLDTREIQDVEWRNIYCLPCCMNCSVVRNLTSEPQANYFMILCSDRKSYKTLVQDILHYIDKKNGNSSVSEKYNSNHHVCHKH